MGLNKTEIYSVLCCFVDAVVVGRGGGRGSAPWRGMGSLMWGRGGGVGGVVGGNK